MPPHFKKGQTIFDPETGEYCRVAAVKQMKMWGVLRTFYRIDSGSGAVLSPERAWREHHEVLARQPVASDYDV